MNEFITIDVNLDSHPKYRRLARLIGHDPMGYLVHILCTLGRHHPTGQIPADRIEDAALWGGEEGVLLAALRVARFYDTDGAETWHGWGERSGAALQDIHEKHEERKRRDREAKAAKREAERLAREAEERGESADGRDVSGDVGACRQTSARVGSTETETHPDTDPSNPPSGSNVLPAGQRAGARAWDQSQGEEVESEVDRVLAGIRQHVNADGGLPRERPAARRILVELCPPGRPFAEHCARILEVLPSIAASGEFGRGELPAHRSKKFRVTDAPSLFKILPDALAMWPRRVPASRRTPAERARWVEDRTGELERATRAAGQRFLTAGQRAEVDAQVQREADDLFGPAARAGPGAPAPSPAPTPTPTTT